MCFTGHTTQTQQQAGIQSTILPEWATGAGQQIFGQAQDYTSANPYKGYTGATEANFGPQWGTATDYATGNIGKTNPFLTNAGDALRTVLGNDSATAGSSVNDLMSPYTKGVLDPTIEAINRNAADRNNATATGATMSGAFGDSGYGVQRGLNDKDTMDAISHATSSAYDNAFKNAQTQKNDALTRILSAASGFNSVGSSDASQKQALASLLTTMGAGEQGAGQTGINTEIGVNNQNQSGQLSQYSALDAILRGAPMNTTTTSIGNTNSQGTQPDNSGWQLAGSALGAAARPGSADSTAGRALLS